MSDLINELSDGEDEFDVDLMAAGCRIALASVNADTVGARQLVDLYGFGVAELTDLVDLLTERGTVAVKDVFAAAEEVSSRRVA